MKVDKIMAAVSYTMSNQSKVAHIYGVNCINSLSNMNAIAWTIPDFME